MRLHEVEAYPISELSLLQIHHQAHKAHEASQPSLFSKGVMTIECNVYFLKFYVQRQLLSWLYIVICVRNQ